MAVTRIGAVDTAAPAESHPDAHTAEAVAAAPAPAAQPPLVEDELLVEDVSIDGMCGVY